MKVMITSIDRRRFCELLAAAAGALMMEGCADRAPAIADSSEPDPPDAGDEGGAPATDWSATAELPSLGGAPDTHDGRVIAAFVDTIVPGSHRDPTGAVGALDVDAAGVVFDPRLPAAELVPLLVAFLDSVAAPEYERPFDELIPSEREQVVVAAIELLPEMSFAVQMAKLATYTTPQAQAHLGYPGPNPGYAKDPNFTFGEALAKPHPAAVEGNLP